MRDFLFNTFKSAERTFSSNASFRRTLISRFARRFFLRISVILPESMVNLKNPLPHGKLITLLFIPL
jgi:hypothetical protein